MTIRSASIRLATALAVLTLAACPGPRPKTAAEFDASHIFTAEDLDASGNPRRIWECLNKGRHGECVQRRCTEGPGSVEWDCASYAAACVLAGFHWAGTKQTGVCSMIL
jgi:hypothetical protein